MLSQPPLNPLKMLEHLGLPQLNTMLTPYFKYRTPKYILVEVPLVGIIHRLCQVGALIYVVYTMVVGSTWAVASVPLGSTNPWIEDGNYSSVGENAKEYAHDEPGGFEYCSNEDFAYNYGGGWLYGTKEDPPICNSPNRHTITEKTVNSIFVTTAYIETSEYGFPCTDLVDESADKQTCTNKFPLKNAGATGSTLKQHANGQCVCTSASKTFYPLAAEEMALSFAHFYNTPTLLANNQISGGSDNKDAEHPLKTTFIRADGTEKKWEPPEEITITLRDLLLSANHASCQTGSVADLRDGKEDGKCEKGITLDEPNVDVRAEIEESSSGEADASGPNFPVATARIEPWAQLGLGMCLMFGLRRGHRNSARRAPPSSSRSSTPTPLMSAPRLETMPGSRPPSRRPCRPAHGAPSAPRPGNAPVSEEQRAPSREHREEEQTAA